MKEAIIIRHWKKKDGTPKLPEPVKKIQQCFHEKQTETQKGDHMIFCECCRQYRVDVDAMREEINIIPKWLRKLVKFLRNRQ
jgi:hypothetical protein